jgi:hypothetical protein
LLALPSNLESNIKVIGYNIPPPWQCDLNPSLAKRLRLEQKIGYSWFTNENKGFRSIKGNKFTSNQTLKKTCKFSELIPSFMK